MFYTCIWGRLDNVPGKKREGDPAGSEAGGGGGGSCDFFLAYAGQRGIITVQLFGQQSFTDRETRQMCFMSHGGAINCLKLHPKASTRPPSDPYLTPI